MTAGSAGRTASTASGRRLVVAADGGSRGNPGVAGYGALGRDAARHVHAMDRNSACHAASVFGSPRW